MADESPPALIRLETHAKASVLVLRSIQAEAHAAAKALADIHAALVEMNRARDRWAREIKTILTEAKDAS